MLRGSTPHDALVPCASGGCENTPQSVRFKNNSISIKCQKAKSWQRSARYLYPLAAASLNEIVGAKKVNPKKVNPKKVNPESQSRKSIQKVNPTILINEAEKNGYK